MRRVRPNASAVAGDEWEAAHEILLRRRASGEVAGVVGTRGASRPRHGPRAVACAPPSGMCCESFGCARVARPPSRHAYRTAAVGALEWVDPPTNARRPLLVEGASRDNRRLVSCRRAARSSAFGTCVCMRRRGMQRMRLTTGMPLPILLLLQDLVHPLRHILPVRAIDPGRRRRARARRLAHRAQLGARKRRDVAPPHVRRRQGSPGG